MQSWGSVGEGCVSGRGVRGRPRSLRFPHRLAALRPIRSLAVGGGRGMQRPHPRFRIGVPRFRAGFPWAGADSWGAGGVAASSGPAEKAQPPPSWRKPSFASPMPLGTPEPQTAACTSMHPTSGAPAGDAILPPRAQTGSPGRQPRRTPRPAARDT